MQHDRLITISAAGNRWAKVWRAQQLRVSELYAKFAAPVRGQETLVTYLRMTKKEQDDRKDVGGFVGGGLAGGVRKNAAVKGRDIVTLDMDAIPAGGTDEVLRRCAGLGCGWCVYSTRKHEPGKPRLRVIIPLDRTVTADEYEPIARKLAEMIEIGWCDPTTFQPVRMMYWPSVCSDGVYVYQYEEDKPFVSADGVLGLYCDWRDMASWPQVPGQKAAHAPAAKQEDPTAKPGVVGAWCRTYNVYQVMEQFLPGAYEPVDGSDERYTFTGGSTAGGAVVYDGGKYLYSHHATDPAGGRLVNAFDLARLHLYGALDDDAKEGTPVVRMPSYERMKRMAVADEAVALLLNQERYDQLQEDFGDAPEDANWMSKLRLNPNTGKPEKCSDNVMLLLENDPRLKGRLYRDSFAERDYGIAPLPWGARETEEGPFPWKEPDDQGLRIYVERVLGFRSKETVADTLGNYLAKYARNPVTEYLNSLAWDGVPRLDTLFIDYLGAADTPYVRAVTRKSLVAAVARAHEPGTKFDNMTIPTGAQGIGKSTLLRKLGRGWFTDGIKTFEGKEASELVQTAWIVEIGELEALNRSDISRIKQFLSQNEDVFRPAYGRVVEWRPRHCVFFGTSNNDEYLRDRTGNRRFWPVDVGVARPIKSVFCDLDEDVDQIWAEAVMRWRLGEPLYLEGAVAKAAEREQDNHTERSPREGVVLAYMDRKVPEPWQTWDLQQRLMWLSGGAKYDGPLVDRTRICAHEVWCEALKGEIRNCRYQESAELNAIMKLAPGWEKTENAIWFKYAGRIKGFVRKGKT